jgi:hypothetical protein
MIECDGVILQERAVLVDVVTVRPSDRKETAAHCSHSRPCEAELLRYLTLRQSFRSYGYTAVLEYIGIAKPLRRRRSSLSREKATSA